MSVKFLQNFITTIRDLTIIKDIIVTTDKYFNDREFSIRDIIPELIWIWNLHNKAIADFMNNKNLIDLEMKKPENEEFESVKHNEFNLIHYRFEDSTFKEKSKEEIQKSSGEQRKQFFFKFNIRVFDKEQKKHANIDLLSIFFVDFFRIFD